MSMFPAAGMVPSCRCLPEFVTHDPQDTEKELMLTLWELVRDSDDEMSSCQGWRDKELVRAPHCSPHLVNFLVS